MVTNPFSLILAHFLVQSVSESVPEWLRLEGPLEIIQPSSSRLSQRRLPSTVPSFEHLHRWDLYSISGQPVPHKLKPTFDS